MKETIRRDPKSPPNGASWRWDCLQDLAAGRHAVKCECAKTLAITGFGLPLYPSLNACLTIAQCALEGKAYEVEVEDAERE